MPYSGFLSIGGVDVVNDCATLQMIADGFGPEGIQCRNCDPCCSDIRAGLGFPNGWGIADRPWFDGTEESTEFAGLLVQALEGLAPGEFTRSSEPLPSNGTAFGRPQQSGPVVTVRALVMARTCAGADFGVRWLRRLLRSNSGCDGIDLTYLATEPRTPDLDCLIDNGDGTFGVDYDDPNVMYDEMDVLYDEAGFSYHTWLGQYFRTIKGASLISGPTVVETIPRACPECHDCATQVVEFTLAARRPCVFLQEINLGRFFFDCTPLDDECIVWTGDDSCVVCDDGMEDCATDPDCQVATPPPMVPIIANPCIRDCINQEVCHLFFNVAPLTFPSSSTGTLNISIFSGDSDMREVKIQVWENPDNLGILQLSECDVLTEINASFVGANSTLVLSGASSTSTIQCANGASVRANAFIGGNQGSPTFGYPILQPGVNYTVLITATDPVSALAFVDVSGAPFEC